MRCMAWWQFRIRWHCGVVTLMKTVGPRSTRNAIISRIVLMSPTTHPGRARMGTRA